MLFSFRAIAIAGSIAAFSRGAGAQVRVSGIAYDSIARRPLAGASVIATPEAGVHDTVFHTTVTAADGHFTLPLLVKGAYVFSLEDPALDSLGLSVPARSIAVPARDTSIVLATPSPLGYARLACGAGATDTTGALVGRVQQFAGSNAAGARIVVSWSDFDIDRQTAKVSTKRLTASVDADSLGTYRMCGVPLGRTLLVQAQAGADVQSGVVEEQVGASHVLVRDFIVSHVRQLAAADSTRVQQSSAAPPAADTAAPLGRYILTGRVQGVDGRAIGSAQVRLFGTNRVTTSTDGGDFRLTGLPGGTQGIEVIALGYYPRRTRVDVGDNTTPLTMRMEKTAVVLDSIRVVAKRLNTSTAYREFEERRTRGMGRYLSEEQIDKRNAFQTSDLFRTMPGLSVSTSRSSSEEQVLSNRGNGFAAKCAMQVFIDGMEVQSTDINLVPPYQIHGIEVYDSVTAPAGFHVRSCGAILV
jgi:Carboxypeptidase regulatory-like domain/TonB-dependent Receptor Plug Domain